MPAEKDKPTIVARVGEMLAAAEADGVHLHLAASRFDDDWLYLVVTPSRPGERASHYAHAMTKIERALRAEGYAQVLLVPSVPEYAGLMDVAENVSTHPG